MIRIGKKVATSQMMARQEGDKATISLSGSGVTIVSESSTKDTAPLLSASMDTISCMLLSKDTGIAVVMAFTWDHQGQRGIGCDVIKFQGRLKKTIKQFGLQFNKAMLQQGKARAAASKLTGVATGNVLADDLPANSTTVADVVPTSSTNSDSTSMEVESSIADSVGGSANREPTIMEEAEDTVSEKMPSFLPNNMPLTARRRRSSALNETEAGYSAIDTVAGGTAGYADCMNADDNNDDSEYITIEGRRSTSFSYMSVEAAGGNHSDVDM